MVSSRKVGQASGHHRPVQLYMIPTVLMCIRVYIPSVHNIYLLGTFVPRYRRYLRTFLYYLRCFLAAGSASAPLAPAAVAAAAFVSASWYSCWITATSRLQPKKIGVGQCIPVGTLSRMRVCPSVAAPPACSPKVSHEHRYLPLVEGINMI